MNVERLPEPIDNDSRLPARQSDSGALISVIERVALNPHVDVDKLERLLAMQQTIMAQNNKAAFAAAMTAAQSEMRPVARDANNPQTRSKYASYAALDNAVRPIYTKHGFSPTFNTGEGAPENHVRVLCELLHEDGHSRSYQFDVPADGKGAKGGDVMTKTHAAVSAVSYGKRTLLGMMFNLATFDDDGNAAGNETLNSDQLTALQAKIDKVGIPLEKVREHAKVKTLAEIRAVNFDKLMRAIDTWGQRKAGQAAK